jgi:hypothetical protein
VIATARSQIARPAEVEPARRLRRRLGPRVHSVRGDGAGVRREASDALAHRRVRLERRWRRDLDALARSEGYREAGLTDEVLWEVVEDATAGASARAGAARLLRERLDATGRARLHECIRVTAAPKLRVALDECAATEHGRTVGGAAHVAHLSRA